MACSDPGAMIPRSGSNNMLYSEDFLSVFIVVVMKVMVMVSDGDENNGDVTRCLQGLPHVTTIDERIVFDGER